jgi:hypothetical protein
MRGTSEGKPELVHYADYWGFVQDARWHNTDTPSQSFSLVRIAPPPASIFDLPEEDAHTFDAFLKTQVHLVKSPDVISGALADEKISRLESIIRQPDPETWLRENLQAAIIPGTYLMRISAKGGSPEEQATIVNRVTSEYLAHTAEYAYGKNRSLNERLRLYSQKISLEIDNLRKEILALESGNPNRAEESERQSDRAKIRFAESELRFLEDTKLRVTLAMERAWWDSRAEARINLIAQAGSHPR